MATSFILSQEQEKFITEALDGKNILVDACIGSGKTTSIQHLCGKFPISTNILYLTYNKLLKIDAKSKIRQKNVTVTNYHGFAYTALMHSGNNCGMSDLIQTFNRIKPNFPVYDVLIIDEYQDIDLELANLLEIVKSYNPSMQIIAVGDMEQKIYDKTTLDVGDFINRFLGKHICMEFTQCFRLNYLHAEMLGRIWNKKIIGVNETCQISEMPVEEVVRFISWQNPKDILCLGKRTGDMSYVLNELEMSYPEKFNKKTVFASISDNDGNRIDPKRNSAIFTTYDSSKGLERKYCIIFDFTESYWSLRVEKPMQSYEILRNIFCVAASRGKERIVFVKRDEGILSEKTLATPVKEQKTIKTIGFSEMFDFKFKESVERCYSQLEIRKLSVNDDSIINIKTHDDMIDLSPCIGHYQEVSFFEKCDIDKEIEFFIKPHDELKYLYTEDIRQSSVAQKVLFLTALETKQKRYKNQVSLPFITEDEMLAIHERLSGVFSKQDDSQVPCKKIFDAIPEKAFEARGLADVVKDGIVYELKFVSNLMHEHFLQCACYTVALNLEKGILWNTRTNEMYEITIPDKEKFCMEVAKTVLKISTDHQDVPNIEKLPVAIAVPSDNSHITSQFCQDENASNGFFAVIDTETNNARRVMSIGLCIAEKDTYNCIEQKYYIINPEAGEPGMFSNRLRIKNCPTPMECSRQTALEEIQSVLARYSVTQVMAYNALFDSRHLPEINMVSWYDIMKIYAYKQFNPYLPTDAEYCRTGRLKNHYDMESAYRLLAGSKHYFETHNAVRDADDELRIMQMLKLPFQIYIDNALITPAVSKTSAVDCDNDYEYPPNRTFSCEKNEMNQEVETCDGTSTTIDNDITISAVSKTSVVDCDNDYEYPPNRISSCEEKEINREVETCDSVSTTMENDLTTPVASEIPTIDGDNDYVCLPNITFSCEKNEMNQEVETRDSVSATMDNDITIPATSETPAIDGDNDYVHSPNITFYCEEKEINRDAETDDNISAADAANLLEVSKSTIYNLIKRGDISARKIRNKYSVSRKSVFQYAERKREMQRRLLIATIIHSIAVAIVIILVMILCLYCTK